MMPPQGKTLIFLPVFLWYNRCRRNARSVPIMSQRSRVLQYLLAGHIASQSDRSFARRIRQIKVPFKPVVRKVVPIHSLVDPTTLFSTPDFAAAVPPRLA